MDSSGEHLENVGLVVWQSAFVLAEYLLRHPPFGQWHDVHAVDLGAGTGERCWSVHVMQVIFSVACTQLCRIVATALLHSLCSLLGTTQVLVHVLPMPWQLCSYLFFCCV